MRDKLKVEKLQYAALMLLRIAEGCLRSIVEVCGMVTAYHRTPSGSYPSTVGSYAAIPDYGGTEKEIAKDDGTQK